MDRNRSVRIYNKFDIITARAAARDLARQNGFSTMDQVGISLATWALARTLRLGEIHDGQIVMDCLEDGTRTGLQIVCTKTNGTSPELSRDMFTNITWLVDELKIEKLPPGGVQITLVKWIDTNEQDLESAGQPSESLRGLLGQEPRVG